MLLYFGEGNRERRGWEYIFSPFLWFFFHFLLQISLSWSFPLCAFSNSLYLLQFLSSPCVSFHLLYLYSSVFFLIFFLFSLPPIYFFSPIPFIPLMPFFLLYFIYLVFCLVIIIIDFTLNLISIVISGIIIIFVYGAFFCQEQRIYEGIAFFRNLQDCLQWSVGQRRMASLLLRITRRKISLLSLMISSRTFCAEIGRTASTGKVTNQCKSYRVLSGKVNTVLSYQFLEICLDGIQHLMSSVEWIL